MCRRWRRPPAGVDHPDESHHAFVFVAEDVAVKLELISNGGLLQGFWNNLRVRTIGLKGPCQPICCQGTKAQILS